MDGVDVFPHHPVTRTGWHIIGADMSHIVIVNQLEDDLTSALLHMKQALFLLKKHDACQCDCFAIADAIDTITDAFGNESRAITRESIVAALDDMNNDRDDEPFVIDDTPRADTTA